MDLNKVMLIGRLTRDPESSTTPQGTALAKFSIATGRMWKDQQGQQKEATEFHNIIAWRRLAEICTQYLKKGKQIYVEGHLQTTSWDDKNSGQKRYRTEVVMDNMIMLGGKDGSSENSGQTYSNQSSQAAATPEMSPAMSMSGPVSDEEIRIEDIPF